jgi:hypothetical protein
MEGLGSPLRKGRLNILHFPPRFATAPSGEQAKIKIIGNIFLSCD